MRANREARRGGKNIAKVDLIKVNLGVTAIPVREDITSDLIANPSADSLGGRV